jgi:transformation/transcription domain-associated protein
MPLSFQSHHTLTVLHVRECNLPPGVVGDEVSRAVEARSLPPWIWFMWIPQLLTSLTRPEAHRVRPILRQLAEVSGCGRG